MYQLTDPLRAIHGVGKATVELCAKQGIITVKDLLLTLPLRYEDRSSKLNIEQAIALNDPKQFVTIQAQISKVNEFYKTGRRITSATLTDDSGQLKAFWFNNRYIKHTLDEEKDFYFSGKISNRGVLTQATVEAVKTDTIHTGRLVPVYSSTLAIKQGSLRRILKSVISNLEPSAAQITELTDIIQAIQQLHFPDDSESLILARERLALEELLALIHKSKQLKNYWKQRQNAIAIKPTLPIIPTNLPYTLTADQEKSLAEIVTDLTSNQPMNRLLVGDVGSGKTIVAALACVQMVLAGQHSVIAAPTQILAKQHADRLSTQFPHIPIKLITSLTTKAKSSLDLQTLSPTLFIGTHSVINKLVDIKPGLIVYDEQHRFGVKQRSLGVTDAVESSVSNKLTAAAHNAHILTMTATPIPRSLMLTIFSHLSLSTIEQLPEGRQPVTTWYVPESKRTGALDWMSKELFANPDRPGQALVVCPFIDPSATQSLENVAAATETFATLQQQFANKPDITMSLLHSRLKPTEKDQIIADLFANKIRLLVTTPIVEVGVDIPAADIMIIEAAERFGLASLHQLRGRVGRAGQKSYCLLFSSSKQAETKTRLTVFTKEHSGIKLAELDLKRRGAGDIFGTTQHGLDELRFASWTNFELIQQAKTMSDKIDAVQPNTWVPLIDWGDEDTKILHN